MGDMLGIDIIVTYSSWPREWQKEADWLRFKKRGWYDKRGNISLYIFY